MTAPARRRPPLALVTELDRARGAIVDALERLPEQPQQAGPRLAAVGRELHGLHGALTVLGDADGAELAQAMQATLATLADAAPSPEQCAALADAGLLLAAGDTALADDRRRQRVLAGLKTAVRAAPPPADAPTDAEAEAEAATRHAAQGPARLPANDPTGLPDDALAALARRELPALQAALLAWFRDAGADDALQRLVASCDRLADAVADDRLRALWRAFAALATDHLGRRVESLPARRLLGRAGTLLQRLAEAGTEPAAAAIGDTVWRIVARLAGSAEPRAVALRAALLPMPAPEEPLRAVRDPAARRAIRAALDAEFASLRDTIDLHLRSGRADPAALDGLAARLDRAAAVIGLAGHGEAETRLHRQARAIAAALPDRERGRWLPIATELLAVEHGLDAAVLDAAPVDDAARPHPQDWQNAARAAVREAAIDLARIKAALERAGHEPGGDPLAPLPALLAGVAAALRLLGPRADAEPVADAAEALAQYAGAGALGGGPVPAALIDAVVALDTWLEARRDGSADAPGLGRTLVGAIDALAIPVAGRDPGVAPLSAAGRADADADADAAAAADAELQTLFRAECAETRATLDALRPAFRRDPAEPRLLAAIRRAFHTLKGSGRTVGAEAIGALGAAIDALLGRCLDGGLAPDAALAAVIDEAIALLPLLIARHADGDARLDAATRALIDRAEPLATGRAPATPDVRAVFCTDARAQLDALRRWRAEAGPAAAAPDPALSRRFHTLRGGAAIVNGVAVSRLAAAMEALLDRWIDVGQPLSQRALALFDATLAQLAHWVDAIAAEQTVAEDAADALILQLASNADPALDAEAEASAETETDPPPASDAAVPADARASANDADGGPVAADAAGADADADADADAENGNAHAVLPPLQPAADTTAKASPKAPSEDEALAAVEIDAELLDIFVGEAQELIDALAAGAEPWPGAQRDARALGSLRRDLHTLKGSARMASALAIGAVAHRLETMLDAAPGEGPDRDEVPDRDDGADARQQRAFAIGLDGLQGLLDRLRDGERLPSRPVLDAIDRALQPAAAASIPEVPAVASANANVEAEAEAEASIEAAIQAGIGAAVAPTPAAGIEAGIALEPEREPEMTAVADAASASAAAPTDWLPGLFADTADAPSLPLARPEMARVPVARLDAMLTQAGEIAIGRARLDEQQAALRVQLHETTQTLARIREQLRQMDIETDAQIAARGSARPAASAEDRYGNEFDALEMDRYSRMQELSRALAESVGDLGSLHGSMEETLAGNDALLQQQARQTIDLQQALMGTLMVPFSRHEQRLARVVRQTAQENGRDAEAVFIGADAEVDRNVLERMTAPLEHLLRNAVVHGIEPADQRRAAGKPAVGRIEIRLVHEGSHLAITVADDGRGLDLAAIRRKAIARGLLDERARLADEALARFILEPGFTTASRLTQDAGRGIGMDVVATQVRQLGGTLELASIPGQGARFTIRLPLALAVAQALLVGVGTEVFAVPMTAIEGVGRLARHDAETLLADPQRAFRFADADWSLRHLADIVGVPRGTLGSGRQVSALLLKLDPARAGGNGHLALVVDRLIGSREIVSKGAGTQLGSITGIAGATILGDGRVALILDLADLIAGPARRTPRETPPSADAAAAPAARSTVLVVDDSVTMRRVSERLLARHGYRVLTARDGVDAMALLHDESPDAVLLDIEMPRADGFEVAAFIRKQPRLARLPIVMVTSRSGEKHRARARALAVDGYLTKPWQEDQLLGTLRALPGLSR